MYNSFVSVGELGGLKEVVEMMLNCLRSYAYTSSDGDLKLVRIVFYKNSAMEDFCKEVPNLIMQMDTANSQTRSQMKCFDSLLKRTNFVY